MGEANRLERYAAAAAALALLSDLALQAVVEDAPVVGTGIGGTTSVLQVDSTTVFVKCLPLTDLERRPENVMSTANLFGLPPCCHYGVGAPSFGAWRELAAHAMTSSWELGGRSQAFPLLYHWRVLDRPVSSDALPDELSDVDRVVEFWHGSTAVRRRIEAIAGSTTTLALFLEHQPVLLPQWLDEQVDLGREAADAAITAVEASLRRDVVAMNAAGLFHFDAHLGNILTDGRRLFLTDFGLAASPRFELSPAELAFVAANRSHDPCHAITRLVDWLVTKQCGIPDWEERDQFVRRCAEGDRPVEVEPAAAAAVIRRYAPVAAVVNDFYRRLHLEDRTTPYPAEEVERACITAGIDRPWSPPRPPEP